jgi:hypothetical protein
VKRDKAKKIGIGWTNFAAVAIETKKGGFKKKIGYLSSNFMNLCRTIHRSVWEVGKIQNSGRCHGNQGTKWPPNTKILRFGEIWFPSRF